MPLPDTYPKPNQPIKPSTVGTWPDTWSEAYHYDNLEVWSGAEKTNAATVGYAAAYRNRRIHTLRMLQKACPPPARVLDLAAAQGNFTAALAGLGYQVTWNDLRGELADYVRLKLPEKSGVEFVAGNVFDLGDTHLGSYDAVLALEVIEHVAHPDQFAAKLGSLLKPGGTLILSTPNGGYFLNKLPRFSDFPDPSVFESVQFKPNSDGHIFLLYEDELRRFAAASGLEVISLELMTNPLTAGHVKLRHVLNVLPKAAVRAGEQVTRVLPSKARSYLSSHIVMSLRKPK